MEKIDHQKSKKVRRSVIHIRMSGKIGDHFYCVCCDVKFKKEADFNIHCNGKKHKNNERIKNEQDAAAASVLVRGVKGCKNMEQFLASYFCKFGLLAKVSSLGPESHGIGRVQYVQPEAVAQVLKAGAAHKHCGLTLRVSNFEYKPQGGDAMRIAAKEEVRKQESAREELHSSISQILDQESSVLDQLIALTEKLSLTWEDFLDRQGIVCKLKEVFTPSHPEVAVYMFGSSFNGFGTQGCDLDLFLNIDLDKPADKKQMKSLQKVLSTRALSAIFTDVLFVPSIRCPIIKFTHKPTGIKCDLSLNNQKALYNTRLLRLYATDQRVRQVVFAVRLWAKFRGLSGGVGASASNLLTSYALTLLVLFYFMRSQPVPVLPAVCDLDNCVPGILEETVEECRCLIIPENAQLPESKNFQSSAKLLQGFFHFYSTEIDWARDALIMADASIAVRATLTQNFNYLNCRIGAMTVIDPFNLAHNVAGNVNENFRELLAGEMKRATELSFDWFKIAASVPDGAVPLGMQDLFELADLQAQHAQNEKSNDENGTKKDAKKGKKSKSKKKVPMRMEGEQENGEFHIILPMSHATLVSEKLKTMAVDSGLSVEHCWLKKAQDLTLCILDTVFLAEMEERISGKTGGEAKIESKAAESENRKEIGLRDGLDFVRSRTSSGESSRSDKILNRSFLDENKKAGEVKMEIEEGQLNKACGLGKKRTSEIAGEDEKTLAKQKQNLTDTNREISNCNIEDEMPKKRLCFTGTSETPSIISNDSVFNGTSSSVMVSTALSCVTTTLTASRSTGSTCTSAMSTSCSTSTSFNNTPVSIERGQAIVSADSVQDLPLQTSLSCRCRFPVWHGRKKLKQDIMQHAHPSICFDSIEIEKEITQRCVKQLTASLASQNPSADNINVKPAISTASENAFTEHTDIFAKENTGRSMREIGFSSPHDFQFEHANVSQKLVVSSDRSADEHTIVSPNVPPDTEISHERTNMRQNALKATNNIIGHTYNEKTDQSAASNEKEADLDLKWQPNEECKQINRNTSVVPNPPETKIKCNNSNGDAEPNTPQKNHNTVQTSSSTNSGTNCSAVGEKEKSTNSTSDNGRQNSIPSTGNDKKATAGCNKEEFCLKFSCDLILNEGESRYSNDDSKTQPSPYLLIKLQPAEDGTKNFKVFYDVFRSLMLRLNASELNVKV